ncbi:glutathione S-transferase C-terminal domain-containing protein [Streptomyces sp. ODS05-4]|uniref:glutathione S-transferase C-terminal domain-containing protein n=1 Tax=Streptomyces sp. ODS05-4 TaxID=2944939 RepID=UPI0021091468|nr:glutathione S-transferase C-terminal domain-containing protein [Streptomyces sp. ODS05-4]
MPATFPPSAAPAFRGRIGATPRSGYPAVPHRYRLHLSLSCTDALRIAVTHRLLGLDRTVPVSVLPAVPDAPGGGHLALRGLYQASDHGHRGPLTAPVLSDDWTGRVVSTHTADILDDLTRHFAHDQPADPRPRGGGTALTAVARLCEQGIDTAAQQAGRADSTGTARDAALRTLLRGLAAAERRLTHREHLLDDRLTLADVHLWATLVRLDTVHRWHLDATAVHRLTDHPRLWAYARRLTAHPAFGPLLDLDGIVRRHHAHCRGREAAGAAMPIVDWASAARQPSSLPA